MFKMVDVKIGGKDMRLRAAPPALLFYKQEFNSDLLTDALSVVAGSSVEGLKILQLVWVMEKMENFGKTFPSFENWLASLEYMDITDDLTFGKVISEVERGFFRKAEQATATSTTE
jgi:hypothetical protein